MKKISSFKIFLSLLLTFGTITFSQSLPHKSLLDLENQARPHFKDAGIKIPQNQKSLELFSYQEQKHKNPGLAVIYSLLLPGMGELYAGSYSSGKYFTIAEGGLWLTYIGFNNYGNWERERYKAFAASNAGVNLNGKNDSYFANISAYVSIYEYNNQQLLNGNYSAIYDVNKYYWNWTEPNRKTFRNMWSSSENAFNDIRFVVGAMILNRLLSVIDAVRLVSAYNKKVDDELSWNVSMGISHQRAFPTTSLNINFQTKF